MDISLEPMSEADGDFRYEVYRVTIKPWLDQIHDWTDEQQRRMILGQLASGTHFAIVRGGLRAGVVQIEERPDAISLSQIEILPEHQGKGIGTAVIRSLMERADDEGKPVVLNVFRVNTSARRLYERLGFRIVAELDHDVEMKFTPHMGARHTPPKPLTRINDRHFLRKIHPNQRVKSQTTYITPELEPMVEAERIEINQGLAIRFDGNRYTVASGRVYVDEGVGGTYFPKEGPGLIGPVTRGTSRAILIYSRYDGPTEQARMQLSRERGISEDDIIAANAIWALVPKRKS